MARPPDMAIPERGILQPFFDQGKTREEVAKIFGVNLARMKRWIIHRKITTRPMRCRGLIRERFSELVHRIPELRNQGFTWKEIGEQFGISHDSARYVGIAIGARERRIMPDKDVLVALREDDMSMQEIANLFGVSRGLVGVWIDIYDLQFYRT